MCIPPIDRELVFIIVVSQRNGRLVNAIAVLIQHHIARTAPTVELTVDVDGVRPSQGILTHVDTEGHVVNASAIVGRGRSIVVAGGIIRTTRSIILTNAGEAGSPAHGIKGNRVGTGHIQVTVGETTGLHNTGTDRVVTRGEVLLVRPSIHLELVAVVLSLRDGNRGGPDAVHVVVAHLVAVTAEVVPRTGNVDEPKGSAVAVHVHAEGDLRSIGHTTGGTAVETDGTQGLVGTGAGVRAVESADTIVHTATFSREISRFASFFGTDPIREGVAVEELVGNAGRA